MQLKKIIPALMVALAASTANADACKHAPGSVTCGKGTVNHLSGNGMVTINGTLVDGATIINGMLTATDANFSLLTVNGGVSLMQCTVQGDAEIKGALNASSSKFDKSVAIFANSVRFINSKISNDLHIHHTDNPGQDVYLDNHSEVAGNIIFDDSHGTVYVRGHSKIGGRVIGGTVIND